MVLHSVHVISLPELQYQLSGAGGPTPSGSRINPTLLSESYGPLSAIVTVTVGTIVHDTFILPMVPVTWTYHRSSTKSPVKNFHTSYEEISVSP